MFLDWEGGGNVTECQLYWSQNVKFWFGRIERFGWWLDAAGPQPDQSIVVGLAEFDPGFHADQIVCRDFAGFKVAILVLAVQEAVLLEKPPDICRSIWAFC